MSHWDKGEWGKAEIMKGTNPHTQGPKSSWGLRTAGRTIAGEESAVALADRRPSTERSEQGRHCQRDNYQRGITGAARRSPSSAEREGLASSTPNPSFSRQEIEWGLALLLRGKVHKGSGSVPRCRILAGLYLQFVHPSISQHTFSIQRHKTKFSCFH